ncbi:DUF1080 domain-containing protein [Candidatus Latescibacterota bacterium]
MMRCIRFLAICCMLPVLMFIRCASNIPGISGAPDIISLWNGEDFTGWEFVLADDSTDARDVWSIENGVIRCTGEPRGYMYTTSDYANYILTVEWRWPGDGGNSGVFVHAQAPYEVWPRTIECQLRSGRAGQFVLSGEGSITVAGKQYNNTEGFMGIAQMQESSEKEFGEWNTYRIICRNNSVSCYVNDVLQNEGTQASYSSGRICLQSEGSPVEFRNIRLESLD